MWTSIRETLTGAVCSVPVVCHGVSAIERLRLLHEHCLAARLGFVTERLGIASLRSEQCML